MRFQKISLLLGYLMWFLKKYSDPQIQQNIYRIVEIKKIFSGEYKLVIQIIGKSTVIECTPQEIVLNDEMLVGFSKKDIRDITYFACKAERNPKNKIVIQEFCEKLNKMLFKLKPINNDEVIVKTANQISLDKKLINSLSVEDVQSISYMAGYEHALNEKN